MKKIVLVGAFDRYNYGDNIMPMLLEMFVKKHHPQVFDEYEFIYAAIVSSDLSQYGVKATIPMADALRLEEVHGVVCVGGEVLCSSSSTLFLHMDHSEQARRLIKFLKKVRLAPVADIACRLFYKLPWEYPYIPDKKFDPKLKIAFNTVGGGVSKRAISQRIYGVRRRLRNANHLSVRDTRTKNYLKNFSSPTLCPDSAVIMSDLVDEIFFEENVSSRLRNGVGNLSEYLVFQAAPHKIGASAHEVVQLLTDLEQKLGVNIVLCPIGYAKGHDDRDYLLELQKISGDRFSYYDNMNVWEIMYVIRYSSLFMGTSLHGVITAISYSIPHIGINRKIKKLDGFLQDWSLPPLNQCYSVKDVSAVAIAAINFPRHELEHNAKVLKEMVFRNNDDLLKNLCMVEL